MLPTPRALAGLLASGALAVSLSGCSPKGHEGASAAGSGPPVSVQLVRAESSGEAPGLVLGGRVEAGSEVTLTATLAGRLTSLPVREGQTFAQGALLATFEAPEARAAMNSAREALASARGRRDLAVREDIRMDSLLAQGAISVRERDLARADRLAAESALARAQSEERQLQSSTSLTAPFEGVVARRHADPGASVVVGTPLLDLRSSGTGEVAVAVPESQLDGLPGRHAEIQVADGPWMPASLTRLDGMTDAATRTRLARFGTTAAHERLEPGAYARVRLAGRPAAGLEGSYASHGSAPALSVPSGALLHRGALSGVYVVREGRAWLRWVRTGSESHGRTEVLAGLDAGTPVALHPDSLSDGRVVKVQP